MRDDSISIAKAFAIMLMVLGHSGFYTVGNNIIYMFHMPLFFFFSGFCFKSASLNFFKSFALKRVKGLYVPYVVASLLFLVLHNVFVYCNIYSADFPWGNHRELLYQQKDYLGLLKDIVLHMRGHEQLLGGFWFMGTLFRCSFISFFCICLCRHLKILVGVMLAASVVLSYYFGNAHLPIVDVGARELIASCFFILGYVWKTEEIHAKIPKKAYIVFAVLLVASSFFFRMEMVSPEYDKIVPWFISALLGIGCVFELSKRIAGLKNGMTRFLAFVGNHTLSILVWHMLCFKLVSLVLVKCQSLPSSQLAEFPTIHAFSSSGGWILYFLVGTLLPIAGVCLKGKAKSLAWKKRGNETTN